MEQINWPWTAKRHDRPDPDIDSQIHTLKDGPPYNSIRMTSHEIEVIRPESEKFRAVDSWRAPESKYTSYGNRMLSEKDEGASYDPYGREYARESSYSVHKEDVDAEADEFIEMEHQKLKQHKWKSTNSISY